MRQLFLQELSFQKVYHFTDTSPPIPQDYGPDQNSRPTYTTLRRFLNKRFETPFLGDGDNLWFFFAGHGIRHEQTDYLMPADGDRTDRQNSAIPIHFIAYRLPISADKVKAQMQSLVAIVNDLFEQAPPRPGLQLDEVELSVEINAEGKVSLISSGGKFGSKGGITLKFVRPS